MAIIIKLLEFKNELIRMLSNYNMRATNMKNRGETPDFNFLEEYGWIGTTVNLVSTALKHTMARFRLKGLHHQSKYSC